MDYEFFELMSLDEAQAFQLHFRESQRQAVEAIRPAAATDGLNLDYSLSTLGDALKWMLRRVSIYWTPVPEDEPWWIRQAHPRGFIQFDDESAKMVFRAACYLGECFARLPGLYWTTGNPEYLGKNMPVIAGFVGDDELPPLVVVNNMYSRILGDGGAIEKIDATIRTWARLSPAARS